MSDKFIATVKSYIVHSNFFPSNLIAPAIAKLPFEPPKDLVIFLDHFSGGFILNGVEFLALDTDLSNIKKTWDSIVRNSSKTFPPSIIFAKGGGGYFFLLKSECDLVFQGFDDGEWGDTQLEFNAFVLDLVENGL